MARKTCNCILIAIAAASLTASFCLPAFARPWYVAPTGSDTAAGSLAKPFRTIQHAAKIATAGDTVFILHGAYHETVTPAHSGTAGRAINFVAYRNQQVTIDGADPVIGWSKTPDGQFRANIAWNLGPGNNQLFEDETMLNEARWPVSGLDPMRPILARAGPATNSTQIRDPNLTQPVGYWVGATVWMLGGNQPYEPWIAQTAKISASAPGSITFPTLPLSGSDYTPVPNSPYYITDGPLSSLKANGEWWIGDGSVYVRLLNSANPARHAIEVKRRQYAFVLDNLSYVTIDGISVFAAGISMQNSTHCTLTGCRLKYLSHFTASGGWNTVDTTGVSISGSDNTLENSTIEYSAGNGVSLLGSSNTVRNCYIRGCDYSGGDSAGIRATGAGQTVSHNTVTECFRTAILNRSLMAGRIVHNDLSYYAMFTKDCGGTYCYETDGAGTVIAYNIFHDSVDSLFKGKKFTCGPYLDNGTKNTIVHHNLVYNVDEGTRMNTPSADNIVVNNTFANNPSGSSLAGQTSDLTGSQVINNIFVQAIEASTGGVFSHNLQPQSNPEFQNAASDDYQLRADSPAIDAGAIAAPYTNGFAGSAPDIGAYETGATAWTAGASIAPHKPINVTAHPSHRGVRVSWSPTSGADSYRVYHRSTMFGPYTLAGKGITGSSFVVKGLASAERCTFVVEAVAHGIAGPLSTAAIATPTSP